MNTDVTFIDLDIIFKFNEERFNSPKDAIYQTLESASCFLDTVWADNNLSDMFFEKKGPLRSILKLDYKVQR